MEADAINFVPVDLFVGCRYHREYSRAVYITFGLLERCHFGRGKRNGPCQNN